MSASRIPSTRPRFTRDRLHGVWSALPIPWGRDGTLDRRLFIRDIARICDARVHGVYSGGTTGEFYAQDFETFCEVNEVLIRTAHAHGTPVQAGCTALDTGEACRRVRHARKLGADVIQIALPFWLEMDDGEVLRFFAAVAEAAGPTPIVHYDTIRSKRRISPKLYQRICARVPTLWGTKFGGTDIWSVKCITMANPNLRVFTGEHILASATPMGATGSYSSVVNANPAWMLGYYEACRTGDWDRAFRLQHEVAVLLAGLGEVSTPNLQDTAEDRMLGQLAGFMKCPLEGKAPYRSGTRGDLLRFRAYVKRRIPHVLRLQEKGRG